MIGIGKAIGLTPAEVKAMSVWEFSAAVDGWNEANSPEEAGMSDLERDELWAKIEAKMGRIN